MKKILKMFLTLATTSVVPLTVVACGQESLDAALNAINKGQTKLPITLIDGQTINREAIETFTLSNDQSDKLAKNIVKEILAQAGLANVDWYQNDLVAGKKCYNANVTNGTVQGNNRKWDVKASSQRFNIKISYYVGHVANDLTFKASQKIDMSFDIKVGTSSYDKELNMWINKFNEQKWNNEKDAINVDLTKIKIDMPGAVSWNDLDLKITTAAYQAINAAIINVNDPTWKARTNIALSVTGSQGTINPTTHILQLKLTGNYGDSYIGDGLAPEINNIYIKFSKN